MSRRQFDVVAAVDEGLGIGAGGDLPWRLPGEMAYFVNLTRTASEGKRNAVFMGRVNWEAIPPRYQPLAGRLNVVLTRRADYEVPDGVLVASSIGAALDTLGEPPWQSEIERVFCVGGGNLYAQAIAMRECERLYVTRVHARFDCDTFFPAFEDRFEPESVARRGRDGDIDWEAQVWRRKPGG